MKRTFLILLALAVAVSAYPVLPAAAQGQTYTVQTGDNLYRIALKFRTTVAAIQTANGLTTTTIKIGQVLTIPGGYSDPGPGYSYCGPSYSAYYGNYYVVCRGDTLSGIARYYGVSTAYLQRRNGIANANRIYAGQFIYP